MDSAQSRLSSQSMLGPESNSNSKQLTSRSLLGKDQVFSHLTDAFLSPLVSAIIIWYPSIILVFFCLLSVEESLGPILMTYIFSTPCWQSCVR